ncbi:MAG: hypothetical protein K2N00_12395 [Lachnospiraceae bacterium]|nr:hypothetical protein [Lachnospiraceae bacterium]
MRQEYLLTDTAAYPEEFILPYIMGVLNAEKIADILLEQCRQGKISQDMAAHLDDFGLMRDKIRIRLVNYGANSGELEGVPHRKFLDLAITYYLDMQADLAGQNGAGAITNALMDIWGVSEDELYRLGMERLLSKDAFQATDIFDLIRNAAQEEQDTETEKAIVELQRDQNRPKMYVVTNKGRFYGANCLLNTSFLQEMAEDSGCSLIVYPSSVHEMVILPQKNGYENRMGTKDIQEINYQHLPKDEWLSNSIYRYDREKREVSIYKEGAPLLW